MWVYYKVRYKHRYNLTRCRGQRKLRGLRCSLEPFQPLWPGRLSPRNPLRQPFDNTAIAKPLFFQRFPYQTLHTRRLLLTAILRKSRQAHTRRRHQRHIRLRKVWETFVDDVCMARVVERADLPAHLVDVYTERVARCHEASGPCARGGGR